MQDTQTNTKKTKLKLDVKESKYATGRRKTSIARVWLKRQLPAQPPRKSRYH